MRSRSAAVVILVVAIAAALGSLVFVALVQRTLQSALDDSARALSAQLRAKMTHDGTKGLADFLSDNVDGGQSIQVLGPDGAVVAASARRVRVVPLSALRPAAGTVVDSQVDTVPGMPDSGPHLLTAEGVAVGGAEYTIVVVSPIGPEQAAVGVISRYLLWGIPILVVVVGGATWMLLGRTLGPVSRIQAGVAGITAARLDADRVPVPRSHDEVARLAISTNDMLDRLDSAQRAQRRFVADASHELRSPLATVLAGLEAAELDPSGRTWRELSGSMQEEGQRMRLLVEDLLVLAALDDGREPQVADVDLDHVVEAASQRLRVARPGLTVTVDTVPVRLGADPSRIAALVENLVSNAGRYARTTVRMRLHRQGEDAVLSVEDDGPGVPPGDRARVFERFVRLDDSRSRSVGGAGLGLSIVMEVAHKHGGLVDVSDSALGGARFEVRLPLQRPSSASR